MEINFRDILVIVGVLVVFGVLADGLRRMWLAKRRANELNFGLEDVHGSEDEYGSELPNGGARLIDDGPAEAAVPVPGSRKEPFIASEPAAPLPGEMVSAPRVVVAETAAPVRPKADPQPVSAPVAERIQEPLLEPGLPVMGSTTVKMAAEEPVAQPEPLQPEPIAAVQVEKPVELELSVPEPAAETRHEQVKTEPLFSFADEPAMAPGRVRPAKSVSVEQPEPDLFADELSLSIKPEADDISARQEEPAVPRRRKYFASHLGRKKDKEAAPEVEPEHSQEPVEEVLVMNLVASKGMPFAGSDVLKIFQNEGLRFGDMNIFHRHVREDGTGQVLFSVANGVEPGTFDLKTMDNSYTPALSFFMGLPGPHQPQQAFRIMVEVVHNIARYLDGTLRDDQHSVLTQQTLEHYRQRISDFERHQLTRRKKSTVRI